MRVDPRPSTYLLIPAQVRLFIQGSTAGYFGHYYIHGITDALNDAKGDFPFELDSSYFVYQGENDITGQIDLNGDGLVNIVPQCNNITDATMNCDNDYSVKSTFEDIDGLEVISASDGLYAIIQEDSGNEIGERMFISSALEHEKDGEELMYYFMAQSGGKYNTRMSELVGIPATSNDGGGSHEFSGVIDLSGMLAKKGRRRKLNQKGGKKTKGPFEPKGSFFEGKKTNKTPEPKGKKNKEPKGKKNEEPEGGFLINAHDGTAKRMAEFMVPINDKLIVLGLQAHNLDSGVVKALKADRGGQVLLYQPDI